MEPIYTFTTNLGNYLLGFGYLGLFLISLIGAATVFLPVPADALIFASSSILNPIVAGVVAGIGSAIGEMSTYYIARGGRKLAEMKQLETNKLQQTERLFRKYGFWSIPFFAATPLPMDLIGLVCGAIKYDARLFFLGALIGKLVRTLLLTTAGYQIIPWIGTMF